MWKHTNDLKIRLQLYIDFEKTYNYVPGVTEKY